MVVAGVTHARSQKYTGNNTKGYVSGILHSKLEYQDVASLKDIILERGQTALEELEGSHTPVNRINQREQQPRQQYYGDNYNRGPPNRRSQGRFNPRAEAAIWRADTPSPIRTLSNPEAYCTICKKDPRRRHEASSHFLRQCPSLPQHERDFFARLYERAFQYRSVPQDQWPEQIMGQKATVKFINTMEDFYGLNEDHYTEEYTGLSRRPLLRSKNRWGKSNL